MAAIEIDQRKVRLYQYLVDNGTITSADVPDAYKSELTLPAVE